MTTNPPNLNRSPHVLRSRPPPVGVSGRPDAATPLASPCYGLHTAATAAFHDPRASGGA